MLLRVLRNLHQSKWPERKTCYLHFKVTQFVLIKVSSESETKRRQLLTPGCCWSATSELWVVAETQAACPLLALKQALCVISCPPTLFLGWSSQIPLHWYTFLRTYLMKKSWFRQWLVVYGKAILHLHQTTLSTSESISYWHLTHFVSVLYKTCNTLTHRMQQCLQIDLNTAAMNKSIILHKHYLIIWFAHRNNICYLCGMFTSHVGLDIQNKVF